MLHGSEYWILRRNDFRALQEAETKFLLAVQVYSVVDGMRNDDVEHSASLKNGLEMSCRELVFRQNAEE